jgi:tetratricopeptide (TPR) repeat protein
MRFLLLSVFGTFCFLSAIIPSSAQPRVSMVVARSAAPLRVGERVTGQTEPGEVFSVITRQEQLIWVQNDQDKKGWLSADQVVPLDQAEPVFEALIRRDPNRAVHYERRAVLFSTRGDMEKAAADYDRAVQLGSKNPNAYLNRGIHHSTQGEFEKAVADYDQAVELGLKDAYIFVNRGVARYALGKFDEAIADFDLAIEGGVKGFSIYVNRASAKLAAGQEVLAIDDLNEAIRLEPKNPAGYYERGRAWQQLDKLDQAVADYDEALKLDPDFVQAYGGRGYVWFLKDESEKAVADFDQLLKRNPQAAVAYNNRGYNKQRLGRYADALADYRRAIELAPKYLLAHQNTAWLLATCPDDSVRDGRAALDIAFKAHQMSEGKSSSVLKALAAAYAESGEFEKAVSWQTKVMEETPEDERPAEQELLDLYRSENPYRMEKPE